MARLPYVRPDDIPPDYADVAARRINLYGILNHSLDGARAFNALGSYIRRGTRLDPRLRELVIASIGYLCRSPYEFSHHVKIGLDAGATEADFDAMIDEVEGRPNTLSVLDKTALALARQMIVAIKVEDATFAALEAALPRDQLIDMVMTISHYAGVVRLLECFRIDVEPDYQRYLERFPLPAG